MADKLERFKIPIPSIEEQNRIVEVLDKFDSEDIKKMERRVATDEKKIEQSTKKLPKNE